MLYWLRVKKREEGFSRNSFSSGFSKVLLGTLAGVALDDALSILFGNCT